MTTDHKLPGVDEMLRSEKRIVEARATLKGKELEEFERSVEVAEGIKLILLAVDLDIQGRHMGAVELREMATKLRDRNSNLAAWPFSETLNLSARRDRELDVLEEITDLIGARERWREEKDRKQFATGADILCQLGEEMP